MYPAVVAGTEIAGASARPGDGAGVVGSDGKGKLISSPRYEKAQLAFREAWDHRPPACSWERAVFEKSVMPVARAELQAAWLEAAQQTEIGPGLL